MPQEYLTIVKGDTPRIPKQVKDKLDIKEGDLVLIQVEKAYGKENMPKHKKVILL